MAQGHRERSTSFSMTKVYDAKVTIKRKKNYSLLVKIDGLHLRKKKEHVFFFFSIK